MKVLLLDIETAPNTAYIWGLFKENIPLARLIDSGYVLCWSAKWLGEEEIKFDSLFYSSAEKMLNGIHSLLDEADAIIHYNGSRFDIPTLNKEFLLYGFSPPAPYKQIDLLQTARARFRFPSNKLDYIAQALGLGKKKETSFELWIKCMNNDPEAWRVMEDYNKHDVVLLEKVYMLLRPWVRGHANYSAHLEKLCCPVCASEKYQKRGYNVTASGKYERFQCTGCGKWFQGRKNLLKVDRFKDI